MHTCALPISLPTLNRGRAAPNKTLSQNCANSVMKWLGQRGIEADRMEAHGCGLETPIDSNETDEGRAKKFKILKEEWEELRGSSRDR